MLASVLMVPDRSTVLSIRVNLPAVQVFQVLPVGLTIAEAVMLDGTSMTRKSLILVVGLNNTL